MRKFFRTVSFFIKCLICIIATSAIVIWTYPYDNFPPLSIQHKICLKMAGCPIEDGECVDCVKNFIVDIKSISAGMTIDEVKDVLGEPKAVSSCGFRLKYLNYGKHWIAFMSGISSCKYPTGIDFMCESCFSNSIPLN